MLKRFLLPLLLTLTTWVDVIYKDIKNLHKPDARLQSCSESVLWGFLPDLEGSAAFQRVELPFPSRRRGFG